MARTRGWGETPGGASGRTPAGFLLTAGTLSLALVLAFASPGEGRQTQEGLAPPGTSEFVPGEVLVDFENDATGAARERARGLAGARITENLSGSDYEVLSVRKPVPEAVRALRASPAVERAEPNFVLHTAFSPNDPLYRKGKQYGLSRVKANGGWNNVPSLGDVAPAGSDPEMGVLDTGYDHNHPDLAGKVTREYDCLDDDGNADRAGTSHGTRVTGVAAARTGNGRGIAAVAPEADVFHGRVVGSGGRGTYADAIECGDLAVAAGAEVVSMSLEGDAYSTLFQEAVDRWNAAGANVVAAAGNSGCGAFLSYPAAFEGVIAVAATDRENRAASFSECGRWVDVAAPGVGVLSTDPGGDYAASGGTSFAAPAVAGVLAMNRAQGETAQEAEADVLATATDLGPGGKDTRYGAGLVSSAGSTAR